jgi:mannonate dehydratase
MKLGCQSGPITDQRLEFFKRHSVSNVCGLFEKSDNRRTFTVAELSGLRDRCAKHGVSLDMITPPFLAPTQIDIAPRPSILLGRSPDRDRDIGDFCTLIRNCAAAGVPAIKYNLNILGVLRTEPEIGRGGARHAAWRLPAARARSTQLTKAGRVTADVFWERIDYFLAHVVPVANEHKVRIACHPHDPGVPPAFQGVDAVLGTVDGLKRFITLHESPYHGLNFCQGTVSEMLADPGREIYDVIRYFGSRNKIFNVHFRNIRGHRDSFREAFPDEGDVDFVRAIAVYREVGYPYMLMPDHIPKHPDDPDGLQAFAFCYGYIRALIQSADALSA